MRSWVTCVSSTARDQLRHPCTRHCCRSHPTPLPLPLCCRCISSRRLTFLSRSLHRQSWKPELMATSHGRMSPPTPAPRQPPHTSITGYRCFRESVSQRGWGVSVDEVARYLARAGDDCGSGPDRAAMMSVRGGLWATQQTDDKRKYWMAETLSPSSSTCEGKVGDTSSATPRRQGRLQGEPPGYLHTSMTSASHITPSHQ